MILNEMSLQVGTAASTHSTQTVIEMASLLYTLQIMSPSQRHERKMFGLVCFVLLF